MSSDTFWSINPKILFQQDRLVEFFPRKEFTREENLNALARLGIYIGIVVSLYKANPMYLYIPVAVLLFTQFIYSHSKKEEKETFEPTDVKPTLNNPFMNPSVSDYIDNPTKPAAPKYYENTEADQKIRADIEEKFGYNLYMDVSELYGKNNGQRQFYTVPSTTIPNDADAFRKWCYKGASTCKDDTNKCVKNLYENPKFSFNRKTE
jgi:hypothetical protein